ncbi:phosphopantothenoylcysteine decarboxylase / phosphopantothenate--cysteine ligase [Micrococcales bacterium KH10]|nr:phosphopantothenoylcysteine decarboxylase / phosphopantothenate--cysteine ligase [Micrococcales bacterium KH10]
MRIVVGISGGIAAYKAVYVVRGLMERGHDVVAVPTQASLNFVGAATWEAITGKPVHTGVFDDVPQVEHVALGRWADLVAVVPATADLLSRATTGRADDLLTSTLLTTAGPVLMAPAMHTEMWEHPATRANVATLRDRGIQVIEPAVGRLTGADSGAGRLPEPDELIATIEAADPTSAGSSTARPLAGRRVLISVGGTREPIDPVRFIGNRSSGRQGFALAAEAKRRGAEVTAVVGSIESHPPGDLEMIRVETAVQMRDEMVARSVDADVIIMAAAVADFRVAATTAHKIKKTDEFDVPRIELVQNPDILAELTGPVRRPGQVIVGFAAETGDDEASALQHAQAKAERKKADLLVFNDVAAAEVFGAGDNSVSLLDRAGHVLGSAAGDKSVVAAAVWDQVETLLDGTRPQ